MPAPKTRAKRAPTAGMPSMAATVDYREVLTLAETAAYLRVREKEVLRLVQEQGLPDRSLGDDWRFLKIALQDWLREPPSKKEALLMQIGAFQDDPDLDAMLGEIHTQRGRPMTQGD